MTEDHGPKIYLLPNLMTAGNLFCGFAATLKILEGALIQASAVPGLNDAAEAAAAGDLVVVTVPVKACFEIPAAPLAGKVVMDTGNYYPSATGRSRSSRAARSPAASCSRDSCRGPRS